jgi:beta-phosphoglucomutase-like phosphatase (HAD superfamily)
VCCEDTEKAKPDPGPVLLALKLLGLRILREK